MRNDSVTKIDYIRLCWDDISMQVFKPNCLKSVWLREEKYIQECGGDERSQQTERRLYLKQIQSPLDIFYT